MRLRDYAENFFRRDADGLSGWIRDRHDRDRRFSKATAQVRDGHLSNHILPRFGSHRMRHLDPAEIDRWLLLLPLNNQTKNHIHSALNIVLAQARRDKVLDLNQMADVERLGAKHEEREIFTLEELGRLFPKDSSKLQVIWVDVFWSNLFLTIAATGARAL
jgi:hypothetical protein